MKMCKWAASGLLALSIACALPCAAFAAEGDVLSIGENKTVAQEVATSDIDAAYLIGALEIDKATAVAVSNVAPALRDDVLVAVAEKDDLYEVDSNGVDIRMPYATRSVLIDDACDVDLGAYACEVSHYDTLRAQNVTFETMREAKRVYDEWLAVYGPMHVCFNVQMEPEQIRAMQVDLDFQDREYKGMNVRDETGLAAYAESAGVRAPKVAVVDSGVSRTHALLDHVVISDESKSSGPAGYEGDANLVSHGTWVAGTVALGVPEGTEIVDLNVVSGVSGNVTFVGNFLEHILYADEIGCDTVNLSWTCGSNAEITAYWDAKLATMKTATLVCAAGNSGVEIGDSVINDGDDGADEPVKLVSNVVPACCENAITVTSSEAGYNFGDPVDFDAYGKYLVLPSLNDDGEFQMVSGTSFSSPQVAAFAADLLVLGVPKAQLYDCIKEMSTDMLEAGWDANSGWGRPCFDESILRKYTKQTVAAPTGGTENAPTTPPPAATTPSYDPSKAVNGDTKMAQTIAFASGKSFNKTYSRNTFALGASAEGKLSYKSSNTGVVRVSSAGRVRMVGLGTATIKVTAAETNAKKKATDTVTVKVTQGVQGLSLSSLSTRTVKASATKAMTVSVLKTQGAETSVTYKKQSVSHKSRTKYFKVNAKTGKLTVAKKCPKGTYKIKVKANAKRTKLWKSKSATATVKVRVK